MCVWVCFVSEVVGISGRSSLLGKSQENKVVCLTHRGCCGDPLASPLYTDLQPHLLQTEGDSRLSRIWVVWFKTRISTWVLGKLMTIWFLEVCALWLKGCVCSCHFNGFLELSGIQPTGLIFNIRKKIFQFRTFSSGGKIPLYCNFTSLNSAKNKKPIGGILKIFGLHRDFHCHGSLS